MYPYSVSKILSFQHVINLKNTEVFLLLLSSFCLFVFCILLPPLPPQTKSSKSGVYFTQTTCFPSDQPYFKCSIAVCGCWSALGNGASGYLWLSLSQTSDYRILRKAGDLLVLLRQVSEGRVNKEEEEDGRLRHPRCSGGGRQALPHHPVFLCPAAVLPLPRWAERARCFT